VVREEEEEGAADCSPQPEVRAAPLPRVEPEAVVTFQFIGKEEHETLILNISSFIVDNIRKGINLRTSKERRCG
jgi:hypothetical protein